MSTFDSKIKEDFGITGKEAINRGIIQPGKRINHRTGNLVEDGWECTRTGNNYPSQYDAVQAYFEIIRQEEADFNEKWASIDLQWVVHRLSDGDTRHTLTERKTGKILFNTGSRMRITDYFEEHPELTHAKKVMPENQLAS